MEKRIQIALVGDFDEKIHTHVAVNESIRHCVPHLHFRLEAPWIPTVSIDPEFLATSRFDGFWLAPGSPYHNDAGVYDLIRWCRENGLPLMGTCGGFQYMLVEYAKNVLNKEHAAHEETDPAAHQPVISRLACSLKGQSENISITKKDSWLYSVLQRDHVRVQYFCSFGLNPVYAKVLDQYPLAFTAHSPDGGPRAFELRAHRFYAGTLFQPSLDSAPGQPNPVVLGFLNKCAIR